MFNKIKRFIPLTLILFLPLSWAATPIGSLYRWIILVLFGYVIIKNRGLIRIDKSSKTIFLLMSIFVIYSTLSILWGNSVLESLKNSLSLFLMLFVAILFTSYDYKEVSLSNLLDRFWLIVGIVSSILFLFGDRAIIGEYGSRTSLRILGTNTDPNEFAGLFTITLSITIYYIINSKGIKKWLSVLVAIVEIYSVLLSGSRGAMLACIISVLLTVLLCTKISTKKIITFIFIGALVTWIFIQYLFPMLPIDIVQRMDFRMLLADGGGGRSVLWENGLSAYVDSNVLRMLFGFGANGLIIVGERGTTATMHNYYLQLLTNFGIIGLLLFLLLVFNIIKKFWKYNIKYVPSIIGMLILSATLTTTPNYKPLWILLMTSLIPKYYLNDKEDNK